MIKYLLWMTAVFGLLLCIADWTGVTNELYGRLVLPYPYVRLPVLVVSLVVIFGAWVNHYPNGDVKDLFKRENSR